MESTKLKNYIKYGYRSSNNVLKRKITIFKFYLLEVLFILTYPLAILGPMIRLAYYKTYIDTRNSKKFRLFNSFNEFNNNKRLVTLILSSLLQKLILLGILLVLALICLMIYLISLGLYLIVKDSMVYIITVIPFVILSIGYLYYIFFLVIPVEQILLVEPSTNVSKVLRMSFQSASRDSKHKYLVFIALSL